MKIHLFPGVNPDDTVYLKHPNWMKRSLTYASGDEAHGTGWNTDNWERQLGFPGAEPANVFQSARARLINLDFQPLNLVQFTSLWAIKERLPQPGDTIFQRTHVLKLGKLLLVDVLSATQLIGVTDEPHCFGFQYTTTLGHPECGTARYQVSLEEKDVSFRIHAIARPGLWTTKLAKPIITRRLQLKIAKGMLDTMVQGVRLDLAAQEG